MPLTQMRQDDQIGASTVYDDDLAAGATLETGSVSLEGDLNALRSQMKRVLGAPAWSSGLVSFVNLDGDSVARDLSTIDQAVDALEVSRRLYPVSILTDISVSPGQNFEVLVAGAAEAPTAPVAAGATALGAVCARSATSGGAFSAHELSEIAGPNAIQPKNLVGVRDATTGQPLQSDGRDIFALLQVESTGVDGAAFNDVSGGARAKLSFVRVNAARDDLEAVPVADIAGETVNVSYMRRVRLRDLPEDAGAAPTFQDHSASVDVTLSNALANQGGPAPLSTSLNVDLSDSVAWAFRDSAGADILSVISNAGSGNSSVMVGADADLFDVDALVNDFARGIRSATSVRRIDVGVDAGVVGTPGAVDDFTLRAGRELFADDGNRAASSWSEAGIKLSETAAEWTAFESAFGEVSLMNAIVQAAGSGGGGGATLYAAATVVTGGPTYLAEGTNLTGVGPSPNLSGPLADYSGAGDFEGDVVIHINGMRVRGGADAAANNDVYPGTSPADGDLRFERRVRNGDVIIMEVR